MKQKTVREILPLLSYLQTLPRDEMKIYISHMDDKTRDALCETVASTIRSSKVPLRQRMMLKKKLDSYKDDLRSLAQKLPRPQQKKKLQQLGGGPLRYVFGTAVPLLLKGYRKNNRKKKKKQQKGKRGK